MAKVAVIKYENGKKTIVLVEEEILDGSGTDNNIDGGFPSSNYLPDQCFDGGGP
jgi:hypothetical protein